MASSGLSFFDTRDRCGCRPTHSQLQLRFLHNVQGAGAVDIYVGSHSRPLVSYLEVGEITEYAPPVCFSPRLKLEVRLAGTSQVVASAELKLAADKAYLVLIAGGAPIQLKAFEDKQRCPPPGKANFRFIHAAAGGPPVTVLIGEQLYGTVSYLQTGQPPYVRIPLGRQTVTIPELGLAVELFVASGGIYTLVALTATSTLLSSTSPGACEQLQPRFDVPAYMGLWYQIASIPQPFQFSCVRSTATYTNLDDGVKVHNVCYNKYWQEVSQLNGTAIAPNPCQPAALEVSFPGIPSFGVNYLVHETDYKGYAMVGSPDRSSFFLLYRHKTICADLYRKLMLKAAQLGYDLEKILIDHGAVQDC